MPVPAFLAAAEPLIAPLDAFFDKVFVMCEEQVGWGSGVALGFGFRCECVCASWTVCVYASG